MEFWDGLALFFAPTSNVKRPLELMCNSNLKISRPHVQIFSKCSLCDKNYGQIHEIFCETLLEESKGKERENLW